MTCNCPMCKAEVPPKLIADLVTEVTGRRHYVCAGTKDGESCREILNARQRMRCCAACGYNNWREVARDRAARR